MASMDDKVIELGPHTRLTVEDVLALVKREFDAGNISNIVVAGERPGGKVFVRTSKMTRSDANWILDKAKLHSLGVE